MIDDSPEDIGSPPEPSRVKRAPPTIDLEASEVSETRKAAGGAAPEHAPQSSPDQSSPDRSSSASASSGEPAAAPAAAISPSVSPSSISPWVIAPISGAVAATLVIAVGWMLGWPAVPPAPSAPQINASAIDDLTARVAGLEQKAGEEAADAARIDALEKSLTALRGDLASLRAQSEKLSAEANNAKSDAKPASGESIAAVDLSTLNERIDQVERLSRDQSAAIAREGEKIADTKPADDVALRRVVAAALLDVAVQLGHPFPVLLRTAKSLSSNADALRPLDAFAATGVPNAASLSRELLTLVPKLSPPAENATSGSGIVDRLQAGASKLVRIERTDATGNDRDAIVARVTAAALRNDLADLRRELNTLSAADRAPAQAWLDRADARDAALAASRQFAADAMTVLAKPSQ